MTKIAWDEIRTAFHVAQIGTVSGAASELGVHHATVIRHIDALEATLGVKLFQRHPRGYTATEAGLDVLRVAQATDDQFAQLVSRVKGQGNSVGGELIVTSLDSLSELVTPALVAFQKEHSDLIVRSLTGARLYRLEYGEAHVAIRAGARPSEPDNVAQKFGDVAYALYASEAYAARHPLPEDDEHLSGHIFVSHDSESMQAPFNRWLHRVVPAEQHRFRITDDRVARDAILSGAGMGFMPVFQAKSFPGLIQALPPRPDWSAPLWIVTHVDLHRTTKVQSFLTFLKKTAATWPGFEP